MWVIVVAGLFATFANAQKKRWCFLVWMPCNAAWVVYDIYKTAYPQAAQMACYFLIAVYGWFKWRDN